ncbi:MAG TPA: DUF885 domain-containing protein [Phnomibacter sp.]|nr:DUF885 domain-containing protein [Phnomibacter sp.]
MRKLISFFALLCYCLCMVSAAWSQAGVTNDALKKLLKEREDHFRSNSNDSLNPLGDFSEAKFKADHDFAVQYLSKLKTLGADSLNFDDQVTLELLKFTTDNDVYTYEYKSYLNPILVDDGFQIELPRFIPKSFRNAHEVDNYLKILNDIPRFCNEHFELMRRGLKAGISQPPVVVQSFAASYNDQIVANATESIFYAPFKTKPAAIDSASWKAYAAKGLQAVKEKILPQYKAIKKFYEEEYIPQTKKSLGVIDYPNGSAFYQQKVNYYTTTEVSYNEVYELGLREVARIEKEMLEVMKETGFKGNLSSFIQMLRTNPKFYAKTPDELLKEASFIAKRIDGKLPQFFGKLPRLPYTVAPVPADLAPNYTAGRYSPGRGTRAGEYWVNTYNLPARSLYNLEALSLHEAVPGHHLQIALSLELENVPAFRRNLYVNAFGEGWALYCEWLGTEMGFYKDPYSRFGKLTYEMWRACRLVLDVAIHTKGWSRQQAVDYLASHTALSMHEVGTEIDRYISWPGQALSYKFGELKIRELRAKAEKELGTAFDIRAFHDMLLSKGTVTLSVMEKMADRFIAEKKSTK